MAKTLLSKKAIPDGSGGTLEAVERASLPENVPFVFQREGQNVYAITAETVDPYSAAVVVRSAVDVAGTLDSSKLYIIDGVIDMGAQTIQVPEGGLTMRGHGFGVSLLRSSEPNFTLFTTGTHSGDLFLTELDITVDGAGSRVWGLNNDGNFSAVECNTVNFIDCTSLGALTDYRQFLARNNAYIRVSDGLEFVGAWSGGAAILDSIALFIGAGVTLFKAGAGLVIGGRVRSNLNALSINDAAAVFDFAESNFAKDGGFLLQGFDCNPDADAIPNMSGSSPKARWRNCGGVRNTYVGGMWVVTASALTPISAANTPVKILGTTSAEDLAWFTVSGDNRLVWDSDLSAEIRVDFFGSFSGSNNRQIKVHIRKFDAATSSLSTIDATTTTLNGGLLGTRAENLGLSGVTTMKTKGDYIEMWVENVTDDSDVTLSEGARLIISERPS